MKIALTKDRTLISIHEEAVDTTTLGDDFATMETLSEEVFEDIKLLLADGSPIESISLAKAKPEVVKTLVKEHTKYVAISELESVKSVKKMEIKENVNVMLKVFTTSFGLSINATMDSVAILDTLLRHCERQGKTEITVRDSFNKSVVVAVAQLELAIDEAIGYIQKVLVDRQTIEAAILGANEASIETITAEAITKQKYTAELPTI